MSNSLNEPTVKSDSGSMQKPLVTLLIVLALAFIAYKFVIEKKEETPAPIAITAEMLKKSPPPTIQVTDVELVKGHVSSVLDPVVVAIAGIKDESEVTDVNQALVEANEQFDSLHASQWPDNARESVAPYLNDFIEQFTSALASAYQISGVREVIEPTANALLTKVKRGLPLP
jgi:hypothetical protein